MEQEGFIKIYRKMLDWEWFSDCKTLSVYLYLLLSANHKDSTWRGHVVKRGQVVTSFDKIQLQTGVSVQSIRTVFKRLKSTGEITVETTSRYSIVTICNYGVYQGFDNHGNTQANMQVNNQPTISQQSANNQLTTNKNDKNEKNEKNDKNIYIVESTNVDSTHSADAEVEAPGMDFEAVWKLYQRKGNKSTAKKRYAKLSTAKKEAIVKYIPYYLAFTEPQYRKGFEVFISKEQWTNTLQDQNGKEIPYLDADGNEMYHVANVADFKEWFNNLVSDTSIPKVQELTPDRQRNLNICYTLYPQYMERAVKTILDNPRYTDMANRGMISFDYIFNPTNLVKICENGEY